MKGFRYLPMERGIRTKYIIECGKLHIYQQDRKGLLYWKWFETKIDHDNPSVDMIIDELQKRGIDL